MKQFLSIPIQLSAIIVAVFLFGGMVPDSIIRVSYTFSVIFKELLSSVLPFMVFFFVTAGILSFKKNAPLILGVMLGCIFISNGLVALLSYLVMWAVGGALSSDTSLVSFTTQAALVQPYFSFSIPLPFSAIHALVTAIALGLVSSFMRIQYVGSVIAIGKRGIEKIIMYMFIPLLPLYVLGFLLKIRSEGIFASLLQQYGSAFIVIVVLQISYLFWFYFLASGFSFKKSWSAMKIAFPSYITAFSTMSSTAAIPISIKSAEKNTGNSELAGVAMPIMANVHLLGDSIVTPILAMVTMLVFQGTLPTFSVYLGFVFYFCVTMFAASGIPGGGLLVMIPIFKSQLGFTSEMVSVIMTIYFLLDSFGTGANVMGDGALVIIVHKILKRLRLA